MQGITANKWETQQYETVLVAAMPKLGKTLFATSAPLPMVVVACDLGKLSIYPEHDRSQILVLPYQELTREMGDMGTSVPKKDVYTKLMRDLAEIARSIKTREPLQLEDGLTFPVPRTVVLDGFSRLNSMLVDGKLALNNMKYTQDIDKKTRYNFWGKRLDDVYTLVQQYASFKACNLVITAWMKAQMDKEGDPTGAWLPDIGGAMDLKTAGVVGSAIMCKRVMGKFKVQVKGDGTYPWIGMRDKYDLPDEIDITLPGNPWSKVFGVVK